MSKKILIVDNDPGIIHLVTNILTNEDYSVLTAVDGLQALDKIQKEQPDLVILDIMMPEINGYDVCYQLRFNKDFTKVPIILLTVRDKALDESVGKCVNIDYLPKPVDAKLLLEKIELLLNH